MTELTAQAFNRPHASIGHHLRGNEAVLDGEIVCLDQYGRSQFKALMFRRTQAFFYAFDLLWLNGEDLRGLPLVGRKVRLRKLIGREKSQLLYLDYLKQNGSGLYTKACESTWKELWRSGKTAATSLMIAAPVGSK